MIARIGRSTSRTVITTGSTDAFVMAAWLPAIVVSATGIRVATKSSPTAISIILPSTEFSMRSLPLRDEVQRDTDYCENRKQHCKDSHNHRVNTS